MNMEIAIQFQAVEQALADMRKKAESVKTAIPHTIGHGNTLATVEQINKISKQLQTLLENYHSFILENQDMAKKSVDRMKKVDQQAGEQFLMK
ncbi:hypothetical protein A374_06246 [Fictibacillus macauensis ZFHKF-1]|uniref:YwqI/YxiC family protein n=1 Tax=Fictibacillus macauensis ZFHKF-1 TaxID=1196324 RepID=I8AK31_9BACL|nr:YwqI/YxiC family protein [Fictibacillus macauensis]EIT86177.1 hypothetical protein A374_06246 [Fictibacillus macauensis ZFHKF-1]